MVFSAFSLHIGKIDVDSPFSCGLHWLLGLLAVLRYGLLILMQGKGFCFAFIRYHITLPLNRSPCKLPSY